VATQVALFALASGVGGTAARVPVAAGLGLGLAGLVAVFALAAGGSAGIRADVWDAAVGSLAGNPLGVGLGRAGAVISERMPGGEPVQHAHNLWLNWAVEAGHPGLLAIVALTVAVVVTLRRVRCRSGFAAASTAGLLGLATICLVDHPTNSLRVASAVRVVLGLLAARAGPGAGPAPGATVRPA
jgi:O-antigen ligase